MKHIVIISIGFLWGIIALAVTAIFGLTWSDASDLAPKFIVVAIVTSYAVTYLFRAQLSATDIKKKYWLPIATIVCGVSIWTVLLFTFAAVSSLIYGRPDLFDGFWYFLTVALGITLTAALPVTYPAAYLTQVLIGRYAKGA